MGRSYVGSMEDALGVFCFSLIQSTARGEMQWYDSLQQLYLYFLSA